MVNEIFSNAKTRMNKAIEHCSNEISQIRTGRASTNIIDNIKVDYYGTPTPLKNISHVVLKFAAMCFTTFSAWSS